MYGFPGNLRYRGKGCNILYMYGLPLPLHVNFILYQAELLYIELFYICHILQSGVHYITVSHLHV